MEQDDRKQYLLLTLVVLGIMFVEDALKSNYSNRREHFATLALGALIILLYYLNYKGKLTKFTRTQANASIAYVIAAAVLFFSVILFFEI